MFLNYEEKEKCFFGLFCNNGIGGKLILRSKVSHEIVVKLIFEGFRKYGTGRKLIFEGIRIYGTGRKRIFVILRKYETGGK